ncbi:MAG: AMP-binding protein [Ideonella sp.]|nr:AMP-binding protein [Ideonella sp.]
MFVEPSPVVLTQRSDPEAPDFRVHADELHRLAQSWTQSSVFARLCPDGVAVTAPQGSRSFSELHANANRLSHAFQAQGLLPGDPVALLCGNRAEFVEVLLAAMRCGLRLTPINTHLRPEEARYIVQDCGARVLVVDQALDAPGLAGQQVARLIIDASGSCGYRDNLAASRPDEVASPAAGSLMLYTSGTTGQPKGVFRREPEVIEAQYADTFAAYRPGDVALCCGPAYHSAPLLFDIRWPLASGVPIVMLEKWDSEQVLSLIQQHRVTHAHMVPTMFQRLLALQPDVRARYDLSSLRFLVHGAAPCPVATKRAMIDWLGPVLTEYYAATEGGNGIHVDSQQWLLKPGTVGRVDPSLGHRIVDDAGQDVPLGTVGRIYFRAPEAGRFEYYRDAAKTAAAYEGNLFTLGDMGYVDADGFLFLTGRAAECIISGGVNIYPREVDEVLMHHPAVLEACTVGAPDEEWGEKVVAVVVPAPGNAPTPELAATLQAHAAQHLARFKCPREVVFDTALPQTGTGKLQRNQVRQRFWQGRDKSI